MSMAPHTKFQNLVINFHDIPVEGAEIHSIDRFGDLFFSEEDPPEKELLAMFLEPIQFDGEIFPVASKVTFRGKFKTTATGECFRCTGDFKLDIKGELDGVLMPQSQFSAHDKPGGKVIHGRTKDKQKSRHHSHSKAERVTDAPGEHEDVSFGEFDGKRVDLRRMLREQLILQLPMVMLCGADCRGLCMGCGGNLNLNECRCKEGPQPVT